MSNGRYNPEIPEYPAPDPTVILPAAPADGWEATRGGRTLTADVVVVGTGPGGSAAARAMAEAGLKVVLLEEGPSTSRFKPNQGQTARYHMQEGGGMVAKGATIFPIAAGRGVGGGSLINSALSFRTPKAVLAEWESLLQDEGWGPAAMGAALDEVERIVGVCITPDRVAGANNRLIARGVQALGLEGGLAPRSTPGCAGCGICNYGCPSNGKASSNVTFLPRAIAAGALIQADVKVHAVLVEGGRAVGVVGESFHPDTGAPVGSVTVRAPKVLLAAGAIGTPRLLWHSGLGPTLGPATGEGLHIHPGSAVIGIADEDILLWRGATQGAWFHHPDWPGVLPHTFTAPPEVCLATLGHVGPRLAEGLALLPRLCGLIVLVSDKGEGRVRATADGRADISYRFAEEDFRRCKGGMRASAEVLLAGGARQLTAPVHGIGVHDSLESFAAALETRTPNDFTMYSAHPMSTCRMGLSAATSVIGPSGEAHGLPGLFIADASIFPSSIGVNPQLTTMAAATVIGRRIAARG